MSRQKSKVFIISILSVIAVIIVAVCVPGLIAEYNTKETLQSNVQISLLLQGDEGDIYESPAVLTSTGTYRLKTENDLEEGESTLELVERQNLYDYVMPGVNIPKDPKVFITKKSGAEAYLYIEVIEDNFPKYYTDDGFEKLPVDVDNAEEIKPICYTLEEFWVPVLDNAGNHVTGLNGGKLYVYYDARDYFINNNYNKTFSIGSTLQNVTCLSSYIMKSESDNYITKQDYYGENEVKIIDGSPIKCPSFNIIKDKTIYVSEKYIHKEYPP